MNYLDLFHGIGGFALGAYWAGMRFDHHYCSDIEPYTQKLYQLRFPDSIQLGDITKIKTEDLPDGDWVISGGFPCQDISIAGKGAGLAGSRSGLWFEYWRIIRDLRPRFAIMENVGALTFRGLDQVLGSLAEIGYNAEWQDIRASDMGAPHKRERIWIVAYPDSERTGRKPGEFCKNDGGQIGQMRGEFVKPGETSSNLAYAASVRRDDWGDHRERRYILCDENRNAEENKSKREGRKCRSCQTCQDVADAASERLQRQAPESWERKHDRLFAERFTGDWSTEPDVGRLVDGLPGRVDRLKGLGNSIVPQIAEILFSRIKELI